jgi:DNA-binding transcriptional ArsR family regulator
MKIVANHQYQKIANSCLIIGELMKGRKTRAELAKKLGLQPSTVTYSTARMIEAGLVREEENAEKDGQGRKAVLLGLNPNYGYIVGIELLVGLYRIVVRDISGTVLLKEECRYDESVTAGKGTRERFVQLVECARKKAEAFSPIRGMCIAIAGIVGKDFHSIINTWTHVLHHEDFSTLLSSFPYPVWFENDANCAAQKYLFQDAKSHDSFLYTLVHYYQKKNVPEQVPTVGIGLGLAIDGTLYRGWNDKAGEFRSYLYDDQTRPGQLHMTNDELIALGSDKDVQKRFMMELLRNLLAARAIFDPRVLYIGGDIVTKDGIDEILHDTFPFLKEEEHCISVVENATWDVSEGACIFVLDALFHVPRVGEQSQSIGQWKTIFANQEENV